LKPSEAIGDVHGIATAKKQLAKFEGVSIEEVLKGELQNLVK
jgi:hypothetical protein